MVAKEAKSTQMATTENCNQGDRKRSLNSDHSMPLSEGPTVLPADFCNAVITVIRDRKTQTKHYGTEQH